MSSGTTTYVTHPDGTVSKRTSKTRTYTHAVEVAVTHESEIARHEEEIARQRDVIVKYAVTHPDVVATCEGYIARHEAEIAALTPGHVNYFVLQWSSSLKGAQAGAHKPYYNSNGRTSRVVEVSK